MAQKIALIALISANLFFGVNRVFCRHFININDTDRDHYKSFNVDLVQHPTDDVSVSFGTLSKCQGPLFQ